MELTEAGDVVSRQVQFLQVSQDSEGPHVLQLVAGEAEDSQRQAEGDSPQITQPWRRESGRAGYVVRGH